MPSSYKITKQYGRGPESALPEGYSDLPQAEAAFNALLKADAAMNVNTTYRIYDFDQIVLEKNTASIDLMKEESAGTQGKDSSATFRPTPFNLAPRPAGIPQNWRKEDEDKDKQK